MTFTVAVTRPLPQGSQTASRLESAGYSVVVAPLLVASDFGDWGSTEGIGSLAITSRTVSMQLAGHPEFHDIPTFCVGAASARSATASGSKVVESAGGDADALFNLLKAKAKPPVVHLSGADQRTDLTAKLNDAGIAAERRIVYKMVGASELPPVDGPLHATLLYSPRTAKIYSGLATLPPWREAPCVVLSPAVAANVPEGVMTIVADKPEEPSLLAALAKLRAGR